MKRPTEENINLPYFAYDAFKPGELAFPVISYFVDRIVPVELDNSCYELKHRNGMPMIVKEKSTSPINGYLLYFNDKVYKQGGIEKDAYDFVRLTKSGSLFKWVVEDIGGEPFNMALGKKKEFGVPYEIYKGNYSGRNDPTFLRTLDYIDENIEYMKDNNQITPTFKCSCKLQMYYMLLWSSIDKYLSLGYGGWNQSGPVKEWSRWEEFELGFKEVKRYHEVYSTREKDKCKLIPDKPKTSIRYYYQLRCNIVHSGKKGNTDVGFLLLSIEELSKVFRKALNLSFYPERYEGYHLSDWRKLLDKNPIV